MEDAADAFTWPQMLWSRTRTFRFESAWMAAQRFMYLNDLSGPDFLHVTSNSRQSRRTPSASALATARRWDRIIDRDVPTLHAFSEAIEESRSLADFSRHGYLLEPSRDIRYCPLCLHHCFHWPFFQFPAVLRCPFHGLDLRDRCHHCGAQVGNGQFVASRVARPLMCPACQTPFAKRNLGHRALDGFPAGEAVFENATKLMRDILRVQMPLSRTHHEFDLRSAATAKLIMNCLFKAAHPDVPHPPWLFGIDGSTRGPMRSKPSGAPPTVVLPRQEADDQTVEGKLAELNRIYKSIGRHLERQVHRICGHVRRPQLRYSYEYESFSGNEYYLLMPADACPCCAVLDWWRARISPQFGLRKYLRDQEWLGPHRLVDFEAWIDDLFPMEPDEAAFTAQSIFSSLAQRMLGLLDDTRLDGRFMNELYWGYADKNALEVRATDLRLLRKKYRDDNLRLYIPRHHVISETLRTELDGSRRDFGFSMASAFTALQQCHAIRQQGPLWKTDNPPVSLGVQRAAQPPRWYEDLARHANERFWFETRNISRHSTQIEREARKRSSGFSCELSPLQLLSRVNTASSATHPAGVPSGGAIWRHGFFQQPGRTEG